MTNQIFSLLKILTLAVVISFGLSYVYAWTAPTQSPPAGNVSAPINTSATAQTKAGGLTVDSATSTKDIVVNGITIGQSSPMYSYSRNHAFGTNALKVNKLGHSNTAIGDVVLYRNIDGSYNTAIGASALQENTLGSYNTAIGTYTLTANKIGSQNTAIGYGADVALDDLTNATALGSSAIVGASNEIQLGNTTVTAVRTSGKIYASDLCTTAGTCLSSAGGVSLGPVYTKTCSYDNQCQCSDNSIMVGMTSGWIMSGESAIYTGSYTIKCRNILN